MDHSIATIERYCVSSIQNSHVVVAFLSFFNAVKMNARARLSFLSNSFF